MSSGFVTEAEIAEAKQKRQEEWEKVRRPDQPLEVAEEPYDSRSLYEKLKEQKDKKDYEYEEAHKLKNLIRGLDDDEVDFLDVVDKAKSVAEQKQQQEENNELRDFREQVASIQEKNLDSKIQADLAKPKVTKMSNRPSQKNLLSGMVRKRTAPESSATSSEEASSTTAKKPTLPTTDTDDTKITSEIETSEAPTTGLYCIGVLPGIGKYSDSSDSDATTDSDDDVEYTPHPWTKPHNKDGHGQCSGK